MTIPYATSGQLGIDLSAVQVLSTTGYPYGNDTSGFTLGQQITASDNSVWVYIKYGTGGSTGLGYVIVFDEDFLGVMMSNDTGALGDKIGIAPAAALVNNYGWVQVYGTCDAIQVAASAAANVALASTSASTPGVIDDAVGSLTKNITGIVLTTARAASQGNAPGELNWPVVGSTN